MPVGVIEAVDSRTGAAKLKFTTLQDGGPDGGAKGRWRGRGAQRKMADVCDPFRGLLLSVVRCSLTTTRVKVEREDALNNKVSDGGR